MRMFKSLVLLFFFVASSSWASIQHVINENTKKVDEYALIIIKDNKVLYKHNTNKVFRVASLSKQFAAAALLKLKDQKNLDLTHKIGKYIFLDASLKNKSIESFANQRSGALRNLPFSENGGDSKYRSEDELCSLVQKLKSRGKDDYFYSNAGYSVIACLIRVASKMSYKNYVENSIFRALKMNNTKVITKNNDSLLNMLSSYKNKFDVSNYIGGGAIESTISDLTKWYESIRDKKLLSKKSYSLLFKKSLDVPNYNYGWFYVPELKVLHHNGKSDMFYSEMFMNLSDKGGAIIILAKGKDFDPTALREKLVKIVGL